ncbi:unnamed protein product [Protopolystoma xenopodis]|uniref:Uncharacterized protein n=1 Tax=Protopolystoma xenopodis TaxID=117903 RepID=A0A3S5A4G1_9PLAT|nr:unnamed protein product [Protopolystoma xenopodis]
MVSALVNDSLSGPAAHSSCRSLRHQQPGPAQTGSPSAQSFIQSQRRRLRPSPTAPYSQPIQAPRPSRMLSPALPMSHPPPATCHLPPASFFMMDVHLCMAKSDWSDDHRSSPTVCIARVQARRAGRGKSETRRPAII